MIYSCTMPSPPVVSGGNVQFSVVIIDENARTCGQNGNCTFSTDRDTMRSNMVTVIAAGLPGTIDAYFSETVTVSPSDIVLWGV